MQEQPILGVMTQVFYIFYGGCLTGVTYSINSEETPRLLEEFKNPVFKTATDSMSKKEIREEGVVITNENEQMLLSIVFFLEAAELQETDYRQEYKTEGTGKIYIYDYNDNTSVFIFENVIEGKTGVVYMPYIQYNFMQGRS